MRGLDGKVAIVPGGATKIGAAVVAAFRAAGTKVMVADINEEAGAALAGDGVAFKATDLRDDGRSQRSSRRRRPSSAAWISSSMSRVPTWTMVLNRRGRSGLKAST
jgi:NAD(P)-dependent dehydrogenase (short-subunit alcohol dehydrogenase family)